MNYDDWKLATPEEEYYYQECPVCGGHSEDAKPCSSRCYQADMM